MRGESEAAFGASVEVADPRGLLDAVDAAQVPSGATTAHLATYWGSPARA